MIMDLQKVGWIGGCVLMAASLLIYNSCWPSKGFRCH